MKNSSLLKTAFASDTYGRNIKDKTSTIANEKNANLDHKINLGHI